MKVEEIDRDALKERVLTERGFWHPFHDVLLQHNPQYLSAYVDFVGAPEKNGALSAKDRDLVYIALNASVAHMYVQGMRRHIELALSNGSTVSEIIEVIQLATSLADQTFALGLKALVDEAPEQLAAIGVVIPSREINAANDEFGASNSGYPRHLAILEQIDPGYAAAYRNFVHAPWSSKVLPAKTRELIAVAINASPATLNENGIVTHMRLALKAGATARDVVEILQLASGIAVHSCSLALPALGEVMLALSERQTSPITPR